MSKRIIICADGTWNQPEKDLKKDFPTNVLKLARAISPIADDGTPQQVFYDWGVGSYYNNVVAGMTGKGLHKNILDNYRYIVQNYNDGDEIFLFGFSRGSYTVRCLCGLINNVGIIKRPDAALINQAFKHYKRSGAAYAPRGEKSIHFRQQHSHPSKEVKFVGVWDTVGAMGIPISFLGLFSDKDEFYDTKIGSNVRYARHAMAIDEHRSDFKPTIWTPRENMSMQQVWFSGSHSNIGGSYKPDKNGTLTSDIPLAWMVQEAEAIGLSIEGHLIDDIVSSDKPASLHNSRRTFYRLKDKYYRDIQHNKGPTLIHQSVQQRWLSDERYRPRNIKELIGDDENWDDYLVT